MSTSSTVPPVTPNPPYTLASCTPADIPAMCACFSAAFALDPVVPHMQKGCDPEARRRKAESSYVQFFEMAEFTGARFWKVVDAGG